MIGPLLPYLAAGHLAQFRVEVLHQVARGIAVSSPELVHPSPDFCWTQLLLGRFHPKETLSNFFGTLPELLAHTHVCKGVAREPETTPIGLPA
jgi:hypothetical protein